MTVMLTPVSTTIGVEETDPEFARSETVQPTAAGSDNSVSVLPTAWVIDDLSATHAMAIRLRRPPASEPPYDGGPSTLATRSARSATGASYASEVPAPRAGEPTARPIRTRELTSASVSAQRYLRTCLEVLNGFRPAAHLRTLAGPVEFGSVVNQLSRRRNGRGHFAQPAAVASARVGASRVATSARHLAVRPSPPTVPVTTFRHAVNLGQTALVRSPASGARRNAPGGAQPFRLVRMRINEPREGIAEVAAVLSFAGSSLAVAMRLERQAEQWVCALVQVI